jgi:hypothetical protein
MAADHICRIITDEEDANYTSTNKDQKHDSCCRWCKKGIKNGGDQGYFLTAIFRLCFASV